MARINVDDTWWVHPYRSNLIRLLDGNEEEADGAALRLWRFAQDHPEGLSKRAFEGLRLASKLLEAGVAEIKGDLIYVKGASKSFDWINKQRELGRQGGLKSAKSRLEKTGSSQPTVVIPEGSPKRAFEGHEGALPKREPSSSSSSSNKKNTYGRKGSPVAEEIYQTYPKRDGDQRKKRGISILESVLTKGKEADVRKAVVHYHDYCLRKDLIGTDKVKQFSTFMGSWEEWVIPPNGSLRLIESMSEEEQIEKGYRL